MRKALLSLFSVGVVGSLLLSACIIKEVSNDSTDDEGKAGNSAAGGTSSKKQSAKGGQSSVSQGGNSGGNSAGGSSAAATSSPAQCDDLEIVSDNGLACTTNSMAAVYRNIHMMIVLDKSGSMDTKPEGFEKSKWEATKEA